MKVVGVGKHLIMPVVDNVADHCNRNGSQKGSSSPDDIHDLGCCYMAVHREHNLKCPFGNGGWNGRMEMEEQDDAYSSLKQARKSK